VIVSILEANPKGLAVTEITRIIRERDLYRRNDGQVPFSPQVSARIHNHPDLFEIDKSVSPSIIRLRKVTEATKDSEPTPPIIAPIPVIQEWWWEGNIQTKIAQYLRSAGWTIKREVDTSTRARGADLEATLGKRVLVVEVKGYPSKLYRRGPSEGQPKRTNPRLQAKHWYAEALLTAILHRQLAPTVEMALAFPDADRYQSLVRRTESALRFLGVGVYLVREDGTVDQRLPHGAA